MLPLLYQLGFNTEGFPNLEDYLYQSVGTLPCQSLLRLALDSVFEEFPEISAVQTKVYRMLKCHLSVINHPSITQFDDISLSNHDFDRVVGPDFHNVQVQTADQIYRFKQILTIRTIVCFLRHNVKYIE